jgi:N-acetylglucosamine-6-phosphate deacetylase
MLITFIADSVFDGVKLRSACPITIEDGKIIALDRVAGARELRLPGILVPGFIDTQVNGGGGALFNHQPDVNALIALITSHAKFGTTSVLPTLITSDINKMSMAADAINEALTQNIPGILGLHFEGPHLSAIKKGIHNDKHIRTLSQQELDIFCRDDIGIKMVTLAPETVSCDTIKTLVENDVIVCLGHSNATYQQTVAALDAGATGFTHLFNAMSALTSREPNMVGAALLDENSWCGLILDGHHVHPATAKLATQAKAKGKMILVTDSMSTIGSNQKSLEFDNHKISLHGDKLTSQTGQLAGSALDMITAVNNARVMLDVSLEEALKMASVYPADFLGINTELPLISVGANADFTLLEKTNNAALHVSQTWISGKQIF